MPVRKWAAVIALSVALNGPLYAQAQAAPGFQSAPRPGALREAIARQRQPLLAAPAKTQRRTMRRNSTATKVTAAVALGFLGFWAGAFTAFGVANATRAPGDGRAFVLTGGAIGAGAGAGLGYWLASR
jgi:hypothetical protein